ncbi:MAG TPA: hypothetical protein VK659_04515 [Asanoa sp.]|nr:hypothetical protein [Asanoa sp.]
METEATNRAIQDGSLSQLLDSTMERFHAEAAYFSTLNGIRTVYIIFDLDEASRIIEIAEPLFTGLKAKIDLAPVMTADDVREGLSRLPRK